MKLVSIQSSLVIVLISICWCLVANVKGLPATDRLRRQANDQTFILPSDGTIGSNTGINISPIGSDSNVDPRLGYGFPQPYNSNPNVWDPYSNSYVVNGPNYYSYPASAPTVVNNPSYRPVYNYTNPYYYNYYGYYYYPPDNNYYVVPTMPPIPSTTPRPTTTTTRPYGNTYIFQFRDVNGTDVPFGDEATFNFGSR